MSSPFDLEKAIAAWRRPYEHNRAFSGNDIEELESSLRDRVEALVGTGLTEDAAFREALRRMGSYGAAEEEYRKVYWEKLRRRRQILPEFLWRLSMLKNYLKVATRNLLRQKGYTFINVGGLALGLTCCLVIFQYVAYEYSFDRFHENERHIYRVIESEGEAYEPGEAWTAFALGPALTAEVPEILHAARLRSGGAIISSPARPERVFEEERAYYTDPAFLEMFTFPLVVGDADSALEPGTIVISESAAQKYFDTDNPIGQVLNWTGAIEKSYRVNGVFRDIPANSQFQFDLLLPMDDLIREDYADVPGAGWGSRNFGTYVQLHPDADRDVVEQKMTTVYKARRAEVVRQMGRTARVWLQPLRDVHLNAEIDGHGVVMGNYRTVYFFTIIGLVTLLIALINYINLATARALDRAREVGVRKVVGAKRRQLMVQFLCESALTILVAAAIAVGLAAALTPVVNNVAGTQTHFGAPDEPWTWAAFVVTLGVCTLLAGLYPAFVLSSFKPVAVLKGKGGFFTRQLWLRRGLVVLQFAAAVVLIGGTVVVYEQLGHMLRMDLGLELEQVLVVDGPPVLPEGTDRATAMITFVQELKRLPDVQQVATSTRVPGQGFNWNGAAVRRAEDDPASVIRAVATYIDTSFADLYALELIAGRGFADLTVANTEDAPWPVIANETAVRTLGFDFPVEAVGQMLDFGGNDARIVGVYRDFNWSSAHEARQNIFFGRTDAGGRISLRVDTADLSDTIAAIEQLYTALFPGNVFRYAFADEFFDRQYRDDERFATLFTLFAGLAIAIACLGLFGLASFTSQQRTKEIGVRKALGASVSGVVTLLSKDLLRLVGIAFILSAPVAYFIMQQWLDRFAYRTEIGPGVFLLVGGLMLLIALASVSLQSVKAALADPAKSLRYE